MKPRRRSICWFGGCKLPYTASDLETLLRAFLVGAGVAPSLQALDDLAVTDNAGRVGTWGLIVEGFALLHAGTAGGGPYLLGMFARACVRDGLLRPEVFLEPAAYTGAPDGGEWGVRGAVPAEVLADPTQRRDALRALRNHATREEWEDA